MNVTQHTIGNDYNDPKMPNKIPHTAQTKSPWADGGTEGRTDGTTDGRTTDGRTLISRKRRMTFRPYRESIANALAVFYLCGELFFLNSRRYYCARFSSHPIRRLLSASDCAAEIWNDAV